MQGTLELKDRNMDGVLDIYDLGVIMTHLIAKISKRTHEKQERGLLLRRTLRLANHSLERTRSARRENVKVSWPGRSARNRKNTDSRIMNPSPKPAISKFTIRKVKVVLSAIYNRFSTRFKT